MVGYKAHLLVDDQILVQLFWVSSGLAISHRSQIRTILMDGSWPVGLGLNFGASRWDSIRVENRVVFPTKRDPMKLFTANDPKIPLPFSCSMDLLDSLGEPMIDSYLSSLLEQGIPREALDIPSGIRSQPGSKT